MAYSDAVKNLKQALESYSSEEEKLTALYKSAIADAEKQHSASLGRIERQYSADRNAAYSDTLREERNLFNLLSQRGLGSSGEAAQAKLNSNVVLANRLGALERGKADSVLDLDLELSNTKTNLLKEEAAKKGELGEKKTKLASDIAKIELERENAEKELKAKYDYLEASKKASEKKEEAAAEQVVGYVPEVTASELAKQLIKSSAENEKYIVTDTDKYRIYKYLGDLKSLYDINEKYYNDLIFALEGYGYEAGNDHDNRIFVICTDANQYYNKRYNEYYDRDILFGMSDDSARYQAGKSARQELLKYIYDKCDTVKDFRICCLNVGIPSPEITAFLNSQDTDSKSDSAKGSATSKTAGKVGDKQHNNTSWSYRV